MEQELVATAAADATKGNEAKGAQTLMRALDILDQVIMGPVKAVDLSKKLALSKTTTHRLVQALKSRDYLSLTRDGYALGPKLLHLGTLVSMQIDYVAVARPFMEQLSQQTGFCVFVGKREDDHSRHLERVTGRQRLRVATSPGDKRFISETGLGKALLLDEDAAILEKLFRQSQPKADKAQVSAWLASMGEHRRRGIVLHESEAGDGVRSIAAPVRDANGQIVIALSIASAAHYLTDDVMRDLAEKVRITAAEISMALGWRPVVTNPAD
ncbi:IclR family transcriptional regulator [Sphingomonas sp. BGYR3]|uniref:IclR family transcriptional regulator n=1 Tax=Sphingomonas sp. BGYR3 TaxID=2975483 RepID=UPI0021A7602B|nr:IclR family transcriptional regulator [Sphingomonas sp. BGYR3]MDG5489744.1 IclR family transcriptional regulator [Sphingomonas sp. BGYR3]